MYAVIQTGGKQYKIQKDETLEIEKLEGEEGAELTFDKVLMIGGEKVIQVGRPTVSGASVTAQIEAQKKTKKVVVYKKKRRKGYEVRRGHRQRVTRVKITAIEAPNKGRRIHGT